MPLTVAVGHVHSERQQVRVLGGRSAWKKVRVYSLFGHAGGLQDVHVDQKSLLVFAHPAQKQRSLLEQALGTESRVKVQRSLPPVEQLLEASPSKGKSLMSLAGW